MARRLLHVMVALMLLCASGVALAASDIAPVPNFLVACEEIGGHVVRGDCSYNAAQQTWGINYAKMRLDAHLALLHALQVDGRPAFRLPRGYVRLPAGIRLFILINLVRLAYGKPPIAGTTAALRLAAQQGAALETDPSLTAASDTSWLHYGSVWARSPLPSTAVYGWMYLDGWMGASNTANIDCTSPGAAGCFGHRAVLLGDYGRFNAMGVSLVHKANYSSETALLVQLAAPTAYRYTWQQAVAHGAGLVALP